MLSIEYVSRVGLLCASPGSLRGNALSVSTVLSLPALGFAHSPQYPYPLALVQEIVTQLLSPPSCSHLLQGSLSALGAAFTSLGGVGSGSPTWETSGEVDLDCAVDSSPAKVFSSNPQTSERGLVQGSLSHLAEYDS